MSTSSESPTPPTAAPRSSEPRGREVYTIARQFVAEIEQQWTERLGKAKMRQLRELLRELNEAL